MTQRRPSSAGRNPAYFLAAYLPELASETPPLLAREMLTLAMKVRRGVVISPPESLKTTILAQAYRLWLSVRAAVFGHEL